MGAGSLWTAGAKRLHRGQCATAGVIPATLSVDSGGNAQTPRAEKTEGLTGPGWNEGIGILPVVPQDHTEVHDPRLTSARVARLATTCPHGRPHIVPIVFTLDGDTLYSAVDRKPKRSQTLQRIENARARPDVTILVDHYDEDWTQLWWIRLRGRARVLDDGEERERALELLAEKYPQYVSDPPDGAVLAVDVQETLTWSAEADDVVPVPKQTVSIHP